MISFSRFSAVLVTAIVALLPFRLSADDTIYTKVDVNPVPIKTPPPEYPSAAKRLGLSGVVAVSIVIDETGKIASAQVVKSSNSDFDASALAAVKKWTFKPGKKDGAAVKTKVTVPLRFDLSEE